MKWEKERDALIAQTMAFVQSVAGRRPEIAAEPPPVERLGTERPVFAANPVPAASEPPALFEPIGSVERTSVPGLEGPPARVLLQTDVRNEIQSRVAAFQAHQHRFHREREAYFKAVLTKARAVTENGSDAPPV
jgi:hypothetical protein